MTFSTLFFDLDATLYPASSGLWNAIKIRIHEFMRERLDLAEREASTLRQTYYQRYGTTLDGLMRHHQVDPEEYLTYVHDIPLEEFIHYSPRLQEILSSLPQDLWVFTNADRRHAERVLALLKLEGEFEGIVDIYALDFQVKPNPQAYQRALTIAGANLPSRCVLFDDLPRNLLPANELGLFTIMVNENEMEPHQADLHIQSLLDLPFQMPALWEE
ncbi:MAG: pyrimidine 5'-nucleotidase [Anaerolineales bacterium]